MSSASSPAKSATSERTERHIFDPSAPTNTVEATGAYLGISRGLAFQGVRDGSIPSLKIGRRRIVVPTARLLELLGETREAAA